MKKLLAMLSLGSALALAAPFAHADVISFDGTDTYNSTTGAIVFITSAVTSGSTGIFLPFTPASTTAFTNFNYITFVPGQLFTATAPTGQTVTFDMTTESYAYVGPILDVYGSGTYTFTNPSGTATGTFGLNTQFGGTGTDVVSFSASSSPTATPEPSSLMLLGTGLVGTAGMLFRRRRA